MIMIRAPFPESVDTLYLPNPQLRNSQSRNLQINHFKAMNGTRYTYVKTPIVQELEYDIQMLSQNKMEQMRVFFIEHAAHNMIIQDWEDALWDVILLSLPLDFTIGPVILFSGCLPQSILDYRGLVGDELDIDYHEEIGSTSLVFSGRYLGQVEVEEE